MFLFVNLFSIIKSGSSEIFQMSAGLYPTPTTSAENDPQHYIDSVRILIQSQMSALTFMAFMKVNLKWFINVPSGPQTVTHP